MSAPLTFSRRLVIDGREIGDATDCYVIAEIGHNHQGSVEQAQAAVRRGEGVRRARGQAAEARQPRPLHPRRSTTSPTTTRTASAPTYGEHREALEFGRDEYHELQRLRERARDHVLRHRVRLAERRLPGRARHAGLQDRLRRPDATRRCSSYVAEIGKPMIVSHRRRHARRRPARLRHDRARSTRRWRSCSARPATRRSGTSSTCA